MGLVNQTITFSAGIVPTASAWTNQFTTLYNLVNGQLDSANVDKVSSDGIMVLDTAQTRTAALTMSQAGLSFSGAISASAWTTNGVVLKTAAATYTDTSTAGSGTSASAVINSFGVPTLAATNASVTTTDAATVYIAGAPAAGTNQTLTNAYSLWVDAGAVRLDGSLTASGGGSLTGTWTDLGTVTTVDINGGTIDGATIGGASAGAGTFTTLSAGAITGSGILSIDDVTDTSSGTTGSIHTDGGLGIAKKLYVGDQVNINPGSVTNDVIIGVNGGNALYGSISLNGDLTASGKVGITGGNNDDNLYVDAATGGGHVFRVGESATSVEFDTNGNVVVNTAAVATTATNGFLYIPSCAGTPTGTPTAKTGRTALVYDSTNNLLYANDGGGWVATNSP